LPCEAFLDAGCGDGRYLAALADELPARRAGCDISERILETARETVRREGGAAELVRANLEALPFPDEAFDLVLSVQVIEHVLDASRTIRELARVLRPGGRLILSTDSSRNLVSRALNAPRSLAVRALRLRGRRAAVIFPHRSFGLDEITDLVTVGGLTVERRETFRFHLDGVGSPVVQRALNRVDRALAPHDLGDIVAVVARR
jgi:SAM-dependent methyltransferase